MVIILLAFFFWFNRLRQENRQLIDFIPQETWQYFEIDFDNKYLKQILKQKKITKRELDNYLINQGLPINLWKSNCKISKLGLAQIELLENDKLRNEKVWLIYSPTDIKLLETLDLKNYYLIYLTKDIVALTNSETLAIKIKNDKSGHFTSLWRNNSDNIAEGYIKLENYLNNINLIKDKKIIENFININKKLRWNINIDKNKDIIVNFDLAIKNNLLNKDLLKTSNKNFITPINTVVIKDFNGRFIFNILEKKLTEQFGGNEDLFKQLLKKKYHVDIEKLYTLFEQPFSIIIQPRNSELELKKILNNQNTPSYFYGLVWQDNSNLIQADNIVDLKKLIQNYLAFKFPVSRKKILPDGTSGFELVADPDQMIWQTKILQNGEEMHFLKFKNYEYAYIQIKDKFIFANSEKMINNILRAPEKEEKDSFYNIFISPKIIERINNSDLSNIYLGAVVKGNYLKIKSKLLWDNLDLNI